MCPAVSNSGIDGRLLGHRPPQPETHVAGPFIGESTAWPARTAAHQHSAETLTGTKAQVDRAADTSGQRA
jgi:hypothetical protein